MEFLNCERAVELANYPNYNYRGENCQFNKVNFVWDDPGVTFDSVGFFTSWSTKGGVRILNCSFINKIPYALQAQRYRGTAIHFEGTWAYIGNNTFDGFYNGISNESIYGTPTAHLLVNGNTFNHITNNVTFSASGFGQIKSNTFNNMKLAYDSTSPYTTRRGNAIYLDHTRGTYVGCSNIINGNRDTTGRISVVRDYGVIVNNSGSYRSTVLGNDFNLLRFGIQTQLNNPNLTLFCNHHLYNDTAWIINPQSGGSMYHLMNQGTGCRPNELRAHNTFKNDDLDIPSYLTNQWRYYAWTPYGQQSSFQTTGNISLNYCNLVTGKDPNEPCTPSAALYCQPFHITTISVLNNLLNEYYGISEGERYSSLEGRLLFAEIIRGYGQLDNNAGLITFLEKESSDEAWKLLIPLYLNGGFYKKIEATIYSLSMSQEEKQAYSDYYGLLAGIKQSGRQIFNLSGSEVTQAQKLASSDVEVSSFAKSLLEWTKGERWVHPIEKIPLSDQFTNIPINHGAANEPIRSSLGEAVPNPADRMTTIRVYVTREDAGLKPELTVHTITGRQVFRQALKTGENKIQINTQEWEPGLYFYSFQRSGQNIATKKLSITK